MGVGRLASGCAIVLLALGRLGGDARSQPNELTTQTTPSSELANRFSALAPPADSRLVQSFAREGDRLAAVDDRGSARVRLPTQAGLPFLLSDRKSGASIEGALADADPIPAEIDGSWVIFRAALGGAHLAERVTEEGSEDFVLFETTA